MKIQVFQQRQCVHAEKCLKMGWSEFVRKRNPLVGSWSGRGEGVMKIISDHRNKMSGRGKQGRWRDKFLVATASLPAVLEASLWLRDCFGSILISSILDMLKLVKTTYVTAIEGKSSFFFASYRYSAFRQRLNKTVTTSSWCHRNILLSQETPTP